MLTVDLSFYTEQYGGTRIPAEAWPDFSRDAAAYVDTITFGRITDDLPGDTLERCRMAICAVAEQDFQQSQGGKWHLPRMMDIVKAMSQVVRHPLSAGGRLLLIGCIRPDCFTEE